MREVRGRMEDGCFVLYVSLHAAPVDAQCSSTKLPIGAVPPFPAAPDLTPNGKRRRFVRRADTKISVP